MRLLQFPHSSERTLHLNPLHDVGLELGEQVRVTVSDVGVLVSARGSSWACELPDHDDKEWLSAATSDGACVAELLQVAPTVIIRVLNFDGVQLWPTGREIGVDDQAVEDARRSERHIEVPADVIPWLARELVLEGSESYVVVAAGASTTPNESAFRLVGSSIAVDVRVSDDRLLVSRIVAKQPTQPSRLILVRGHVRFVDASRSARLSYADAEELRQLAVADNAYLAIWNEYNQLEKDAARRAAADLGWAQYDHARRRIDGTWEFELRKHARTDALVERLGTERVGLEAGPTVAFDESIKSTNANGRSIIGDGFVSGHHTIVIAPSSGAESPRVASSGYITGSYTLDRVRIERRDIAQGAMAAGETFPVKQLARILGDLPPASPGRTKRHPPVSARVRDILGGSPTPAQLQAIEIAINSPDVALIQGPPGTGKTRVIAAIQARLAEINQDSPALTQRVLLTSYQHDAVANLVHAADDGALPAVKLGRQDGREDVSHLTAWTHDLVHKLELRHEGARANTYLRAQRGLQDRTDYYLSQPFELRGTVELLGWVEQQVDLLGAEIAHQARKLARRLQFELGAAGAHNQTQILRLARRLRTTAPAYEDDGSMNARAAYTTQSFFDTLNTEQRHLLETAATGALEPDVAAAAQLDIRGSVIDRILDGRSRSSFMARFPEVEALLQRALVEADRQVNQAVSPIDRAIEAFRDVVERQPAAIHDSIKMHTRALAATCQQSVSGSVRATQTVPFDTVIVDEAARANPLDLMIPLALAKGRVILVGDHRQLPQLLDDTIVPQLSNRHDPEIVTSVLRRSLFERLFTKLQVAQRRDGRTRVITLDRQFRTHPVLGSFINAQFYEPFGERVENGISDESHFNHGLARYGSAACGWINVSRAVDGEARAGSSIARSAEAQVIVHELTEALQVDDELTFGVITFYKGQERELWRAMRDAGLATQDDQLNPSYAWLWTSRGLPRVRIGTVDAFQGREFDVVYLSTTRSRPPGPRRNQQFGFLVLPNRLCVAMSRQRKLLIVVGDEEMFSSRDAHEAVPALHAFHELTGGEHGFRRSA